MSTPSGYPERVERRRPSALADVADVIADKGMVIDAFVRIAPIGTEILFIDARSVTASIDTYLRFADAVNHFDIPSTPRPREIARAASRAPLA